MAAVPRAPQQPGQRRRLAARYAPRELLGAGSYGSVCVAEDLEADTVVAIKRFKGAFDNPVVCKRFLREISILSRLDHVNVVKLHEAFAPGGVRRCNEVYMVMELADSDLKNLCSMDVTLTPLHIHTLLYNLLRGVRYIHSAGVCHRDLKPANCLVNQDCTVKIRDFGSARALGGGSPRHQRAPRSSGEENRIPQVTFTQRFRRQLTGHRCYRAPEIILRQRCCTTAIDMWSVGCIFAELLGMLEGTEIVDRAPLFPGRSCFPLSPHSERKQDYKYHTQRNQDMLSKIFDIMGTPSDSEVEELDCKEAKACVRLYPLRAGTGLTAKLPRADGASVDFLEQILRFSPGSRVSAKQALEHPLFQSFRDIELESVAPARVEFDFAAGDQDPDEDALRLKLWAALRRYDREM